MRLLGVMCCLTSLLLAFVLFSAIPGPASALCYEYSKLDRSFASRTNRARAHKDVRRLTLDPHLSWTARYHTREMIRKDELVHTPITKLGRRVTRWVAIAENIGVGPSVKSIHRAFMKSAGHRANVLRAAYRFMGLGAIKKGRKIWVTVIFEAKRNPGTRLKMPSC